MQTAEGLRAKVSEGFQPEFVFFWGHGPGDETACLSNFYQAPFEVDGQRYFTSEQFFMAEKARTFGDDASLSRIMATYNPGLAKSIGRHVSGYDDDVWSEKRVGVMARGLAAKFGQNQELGDYLRSLDGKIIVEDSPHDRVWGIGMRHFGPNARDVGMWRGRNLLGFTLMHVRDTMK